MDGKDSKIIEVDGGRYALVCLCGSGQAVCPAGEFIIKVGSDILVVDEEADGIVHTKDGEQVELPFVDGGAGLPTEVITDHFAILVFADGIVSVEGEDGIIEVFFFGVETTNDTRAGFRGGIARFNGHTQVDIICGR